MENILGSLINWDWIDKLKINYQCPNLWVWAPKNTLSSIASSVYTHLSRNDWTTPWSRWRDIWGLKILPRTKVFIWKLAHRKLVTGSYLYQLNIGHFVNCLFCSLFEETAKHVIWNCSKLAPLWRDLLSRLGIVLFSAPALHTGHWLTSFRNPWIKAMIANLAWLIWKERCNLIFNDKLPILTCLSPGPGHYPRTTRKIHAILSGNPLNFTSLTIQSPSILMPLGRLHLISCVWVLSLFLIQVLFCLQVVKAILWILP